MRALVLSQPKAGTYLLASLLEELGLKFTYFHISENKYENYSKTKKIGRNVNSIMSPLANTIKLIKDKEFAVSHLGYSKDNEILLRDFKKLVILRDWKEATASMRRFCKTTGRRLDTASHKRKYDGIYGWQSKDGVFTLHFYDLVGKKIKKIDNLQLFLFGSIVFDSEIAISKALQKNTLTKSTDRK